MDLIIQRLTKSREIPTFGVMLYESQIPFALTLERPWRDNQKSISCILPGSYTCERVISPKFGVTFEILNVFGRAEILFHKGNIQEDSHGCVLIGEQFGVLSNEPAILAAKEGFEEFMRITSSVDTFTLFIRDPK